VLDRWGIIYNQPIVLGTRQAGAAIEGAVRQQVVNTIERIAVDTHGYTDFAMGLARLLGFDLCPRLKSLNDRLLHVPVDFPFTTTIASIVRPSLNLSIMDSSWDELVRLVASIQAGKVTATAVLRRVGSMATGDPLYCAGRTLGQLERSIFLCDVLTSDDFRRALHRDLSHGQGVHSWQRKIYQGGMGAKRGRRSEELAAISGSLTLLTNIVMAWNTLLLQIYFKRSLQGTCEIAIEHLSQITPIHHRYINFNGHFIFPIEQGEERLFQQSAASAG
jgi:TnpA family transposase